MMKRNLLSVIILLTLTAPGFAQQHTLRLNTAFSGPVRAIFEGVVKEVCARNNLKVKVQAPSAERALQQANSGADDGDGPRIAGLSEIYANLIQVPEKVVDVEFSAFSKKDIQIKDWESLKPYRVGILIGWKILEANIVGTKSLRKVKDAKTLFKLLENDRIQVAVINKVDGQAIIRRENLKNIKLITPPLAVREMFLYLHKKHKDLVPQIAASLKELKDEGAYQQISDRALAE